MDPRSRETLSTPGVCSCGAPGEVRCGEPGGAPPHRELPGAPVLPGAREGFGAPTGRAHGPAAVVLTGGGALGAYEAGVMRYVLGELPRRIGPHARIDVFAGTSAGALNACALASMAHDPRAAALRLDTYWRGLSMERILAFGIEQARHLPEVLLGRRLAPGPLRQSPRRSPPGAPHPPIGGIFDTSPLHREMSLNIPWELLHENLRSGVVRGVAVCATEVCTSRSVVFYDTADPEAYRPGFDTSREDRHVRMGVDHAMASAAIPFLFPSVQLDGVCYVDGALRQNTPIYPALRFGAERLLVIGLKSAAGDRHRRARWGCLRNPFPGMLFLLGRTVNAVVEGRVDDELHRIQTFNALMAGGEEAFGPSFLPSLNRATRRFRNADYRPVRTLLLQPSRDLSELALEALEEAPEEARLPGPTGRLVGALLRSTPMLESQLAAYLLFTPRFLNKLADLGYEDASREHARLAEFLGEGGAREAVREVG